MGAFTIAGSLAALVTYSLWRVIYNLYFHPLAKFPGPWWARASYLPEMYFDIVLGGRYFSQVEKMHERYGPLVRCTPHELHVNDPELFEQMCGKGSQRRNKDKASARVSAAPTSELATIDHEHHRIRRAPLNNFFSKQAILQLEPLLQSKIDKFVEKLKFVHRDGLVLDAREAYGALTTDIISHYAYGESFGCLDQPGFAHNHLSDTNGLLFVGHILKHFPLLVDAMKALPQWVLVLMSKGMNSVMDIKKRSKAYAIRTLEWRKASAGQINPSLKPSTIFEALTDPSVPEQERNIERLTDEGLSVMVAGMETTARYLTIITCYILSYPAVLSKLQAELKTLMPTPNSCASWAQLETLPYLSAVINEGLRCNSMLTFRVTRVIMEPLEYGDLVVPPGTSMGAMLRGLNNYPDYFPDPEVFRPERWIEAHARGEYLNKHLASFAKGSRMCLGINLAYAELSLTIANIIRKFDLELVDSGLGDIEPYRDYAMGFNKDYHFGIRVKVAKVLED